jgi:A/G-specific adenine glycosylase
VDSTRGKELLWERAEALVKAATDPRVLNSALMELGQTHCRPTKPACDLCPLKSECRAKEPETLPVKSARTELSEVTERVFFLRTKEGVLLEQESGSRRTGLWKLPALPESMAAKFPPVLMKSRYGITRYKVTLWVHEAPKLKKWAEGCQFIPHSKLADVAMPSPYRRALESLMREREGELL